jgi:hypothetical protein
MRCTRGSGSYCFLRPPGIVLTTITSALIKSPLGAITRVRYAERARFRARLVRAVCGCLRLVGRARDAIELAHTYRRLGELYDERGDAKRAISWYDRFAALWAGSDTPALQAQVRTVRDRIDRLRQRER